MDLDKLKEVELEILKKFSDICSKYNLRYSLHFGTLLGCIRHKGFIPWDDDVDVMMPIEDYQKFCSIAQEELGEDYFFQDEETDNLRYTFSKIRKNKTCVVTSTSRKEKFCNHGVYIDIFPIGYLPRNKIIQYIQKVVLVIIGQINTTYCVEIVSNKDKLYVKIIKSLLLLLNKAIPYKFLSLLYKKISSWGNDRNSDFLCGYYAEKRDFINACKFEKDLFDNLISMEFEGENFLVPSNYDRILTQLYGNYMKLPPENERETHGFVYFDLKHNYEECLQNNVLKDIEYEQ